MKNLYERCTGLTYLFQLRISTQSAESIKYELLTSGISESALFPNLEGIAAEIKYEYGFEDTFRI